MPTIMVIWVKDLLRFVPYITTTCAYKNSVNDLLTPLYDICLLKSIYNKKKPPMTVIESPQKMLSLL
jgi:hypothetical protein